MFQLSKNIGYVLYSALGSFYIPSCIMVFVYVRIYYAAKARARRGIRKTQKKIPASKVCSSSSSLQTRPIGYGGSGISPVTITAGGPPSVTTPTTVTTPVTNNATDNRNNTISVVIEPRQTAIPVVTCDYASDASTSDNMDPPTDTGISCGGGGEKDTLKVFTTATTKSPYGGLNLAGAGGVGSAATTTSFKGSTLSINGDLVTGTRCRAPSVGVDTDLVSEFDPSSSDSGVVQKCAIVKPLRLRLCRPTALFRKSASSKQQQQKTFEIIDMENLKSGGDGDHRHHGGHHHHHGGGHHHHHHTRSPEVKVSKPRDAEREKRRIARKKEKRATLILGLIMGSFILCWLPFFMLYILSPICSCQIPHFLSAGAFWLGYMNSALNPVIYTIFNKDFRRAFRRILFK